MGSTRSTLALALTLAVSTAMPATAAAEEWVKLENDHKLTLLKGNTLRADGGNWSVYYAPDGRKLAKTSSGRKERKWWVNDAGKFCETMVRDAKEVCDITQGLQIKVEQKKIRFRTSQGTKWAAWIVEGNADNL